MASLLAVPANEGMRSARLGGTGSLGHRRAPGACRPVGNGWVGHIAIAGRRPRSGASRRRASLSRPCASQQGWRRGLGLFAAETRGAQSSRATVEAGQPRWWLGMCSGSTAEQPDRLARGREKCLSPGVSRCRRCRRCRLSVEGVEGVGVSRVLTLLTPLTTSEHPGCQRWLTPVSAVSRGCRGGVG